MCTGIRLRAENGAIIYARTLEFGQPIESEIMVIPRNYPYKGTTPEGKDEGLSWKSKYAVVGMNAFGLMHLLDGVNEAGLAGGLFYFPGFAEYQAIAAEDYRQSLAPWELITWILTNFSTVAEVKHAITKIKVGNVIFKQWGFVPPVHAVVHDAQGNSLVIEYVKGALNLYDNPLGVITNSPTFDWHCITLDNYIALKAFNIPDVILHNGVKVSSLGQGSGMLGLPGDFTPPSRFVRAVAFSQTVQIGKNENEALDAAFHVLNLFNIPKGTVQHRQGDKVIFDYTQWTSAADLKNKRYYYHTYEDSQVYSIDLKKYLEIQNPVTASIKTEQKITEIKFEK